MTWAGNEPPPTKATHTRIEQTPASGNCVVCGNYASIPPRRQAFLRPAGTWGYKHHSLYSCRTACCTLLMYKTHLAGRRGGRAPEGGAGGRTHSPVSSAVGDTFTTFSPLRKPKKSIRSVFYLQTNAENSQALIFLKYILSYSTRGPNIRV